MQVHDKTEHLLILLSKHPLFVSSQCTSN